MLPLKPASDQNAKIIFVFLAGEQGRGILRPPSLLFLKSKKTHFKYSLILEDN